MDQEIEQEEIKPLIFNYIFHIFLFIVYLALHIVIHSKLYWIYNSLGIIFQICSYFNIIYFIFPIYPFIIILKKMYKKKIIIILKTVTMIFLILVVTLGLIIFIVFLINSIKSKTFFKECPFNLNMEHLNAVFESYYGKNTKSNDLKNKCKSRRCVFYQENQNEEYPFYYLCNYDPTDEFDEDGVYTRKSKYGQEFSVNKLLICNSVPSNYNSIRFSDSKLYSYLDLCYYYTDFYRCKRFNKPEKHYNLDLDAECPDSNYLLLTYILCFLIVVLDIIIAFLPWGIEYITFKKLATVLSIRRRKTNSNNSTAKSSEISQDEESYKKEETPVIIVEREEKNNDLNNLNSKNEDDDLVLTLKKKKININELNLDNISEDEKDIYKQPPSLINKIQTSERYKINTNNIGIDVKSKDQGIDININNENQYQKRNNIIHRYLQSTTLISNQVRPLEIKINNKNSEM